MIVDNGYIKIRSANEVDAQFDKKGYPVPSTGEWGDPIPCRYTSTSLSYKAQSNGERFTKANYDIVVTLQPFDVANLRLFTKNDILLGEYEIISINHNDLVNTTRIKV